MTALRHAPIVRALAHRNYRLYFGGQLVSVTGTWVQQIALAWLVYRLTDSTLMLGVVTFAGAIPTLLLSPFAGVLADRLPRRTLLVATQSLACVHAIALASLTLSGLASPGTLVGMALTLGLINAVDQSVRQAFVPELVERREDIANAVALTSFTIHSSRFIGPTIGGILVVTVGEAVCFLVNAFSYACVVLVLLAMRVRHTPRARQPVFEALRDGVRYAARHESIRLLLFIVGTMALFGSSYTTLLPYFARDIYGGNAQAFGFMAAASGLGACLGALYLASQSNSETIGRTVSKAAMMVSFALVVFSMTSIFAVAVAALIVAGFCSINAVAASNALIQTMVDDHMRGRVMSLFTMSFFGLTPVGALAAGVAADQIGGRATLLVCACAIFAMAVTSWRAPKWAAAPPAEAELAAAELATIEPGRVHR